jgi:hypothetical protein
MVCFIPKILFWENFGGSCNGRCWNILWPSCYILMPIGKLNGHSLHFAVIWYIFPRSGMLYPEKSGKPGRKKTRVLFRFAEFCFVQSAHKIALLRARARTPAATTETH